MENFFGIYSLSESGFKFPPGDKKLLFSVAETIRTYQKAENDNPHHSLNLKHFEFGEDYVNCHTLPTPIGNLYYDGEKNLRPRKRAANQMKSSNVSTDITNDSNYVPECISQLVKYMQDGLINKMTKLSKENGLVNLRPEMSAVRKESVISMLTSCDLMNPNSRGAAVGDHYAVANVMCACEIPEKSISMHFRFKAETTQILKSILSNDGADADKIGKHFELCWVLSNLYKHAKLHNKRNKLNGM